MFNDLSIYWRSDSPKRFKLPKFLKRFTRRSLGKGGLRRLLASLLAILVLLSSIRYFYFRPDSAQAADIFIGLNEGYGTSANDTNSTVSAGTITNAVWRTEDLCKTGKCLYFDGTGDYVSYSDDANLDMGSGDTVTIEGWFRTSDISSGTRTLISKYESTGADGGYQITMNSSGYLVFGIDNDNTSFPSDSVTSTLAYDDNHWHHFAAVKDAASSLTLYVDGHSVGTPDASPAADVSNNDTFYIGIDNGSTNGWVGFIDEIKILRTARTAAQVKADFLGETPSRGTAASFSPDTSFLSQGLVGYWKMDENTGTISTSDSSGNNKTATFNNVDSTDWVTGKFGSTIDLDGSTEYMHVSSPSLPTGDFTYSTWVYLDSITDETIFNILDGGGTPANELLVYINSSNKVQFQIDSAATTVTSTNSVSSATWTHIAVTRSGSIMNIYINGSQDSATGSDGDALSFSSCYLLMGVDADSTGTNCDGSLGNYLDGRIDEARIYNRALSPAEISSLYNWAPGPVAYYSFDENTGGTQTITVDSCCSTGATNDSNTITISHTTSGSNRLMLVGVSAKNGNLETVSSVTYNSVSLTEVGNASYGAPDGDAYISMWRLVAPDTGTHNVVVTFSGTMSGQGAAAGVITFNGVNQTTPLGTFTSNAGSSGTASVNVTSATGELVFDTVAFKEDTGGTLTVGGGQNQQWNVDQNQIDAGASTEPGATSVTMSWTDDPRKWAIGAVPVKPSVGTVYDRSGNGNHGTMEASMTESDWVPGKFGSALDFDGSDDAITIATANDSYVDFNGSEAFSGSAWVYISTMPGASNQDAIITKYDETSTLRGYRLVVENDDADTTGNFQVEIYDESADQAITATGADDTVNTNTWYHVAFTFNGGTAGAAGDLKIYTNGSLTGSNSLNASFLGLEDVAVDFSVGDYDTTDAVSNNSAFTGIIDDVRIYNYARTPGQIIEDMNAGHPAPGSPVGSAVAEWKFDEGYGDTTYDSSIQTNNLDLGGSSQTCPASGTVPCPSRTNAGKFNKALAFDGTDDYARIGTASSLDITDDITLSAWVNTNTVSGGIKAIIVRNNPTGDSPMNYKLELNNDEINFVFHETAGTFNIWSTSNANLQTNTWYHVVSTYDKDRSVTAQTYINGVLQAGSWTDGGGGASLPTDSGNELLIGRGYTVIQAQIWDGEIDEVKIFRSALTADQVKVLYNQSSASVWGALSTDSSNNPSWSAADEYCPPGQGSTCTAPVGEWKLDENTGTSTTNDTSGNEKSGTLGGVTNVSWQPGKFGSALNFTGSTSNYVNVGDQSLYDFGASQDFTVMAWVKTTQTAVLNEWPQVVGKEGDATRNGFVINLHNSSTPGWFAQIYQGGTNYNTLGTVVNVADGNWHQLTLVRGGSTLYAYTDGKFTNSASVSTGSIANAQNLQFGTDTWAGSEYEGIIDEIKIYNYARSQAQIAWDFNRGKPIGWWKFDECTDATAYDSGSNTYTGTITPGDASGDNDTVGTCSSGTTTEMWNDGTNGKRNASLGFDGTNDYVSISDNANLRFDAATADFSLFAWVKRAVSGTNHTVVAKEEADNDGWRLLLTSGNTVQCSVAAVDVTSSSTITDTNWHYVGCTIDRDGNGQTYIDGRADGTATAISSTAMATTSTVRIGTNSIGTPTNYFSGQIDDVQIFNYALTLQQIKTLYNEGAVSFVPITGSP